MITIFRKRELSAYENQIDTEQRTADFLHPI